MADQSQSTAAVPPLEHKEESNFWLPLIAIILATFVSVLSSSLVNVALPKLSTVFGVPTTTIQWVVTGFMLASAVVIPASGFLSARFGSKQVLLLSVIGFTVGSLLCGLAWNDSSLIAFRIFQGLTGGFIMPIGMAVIYTIVPRQQIGLAMGIWGVAAMVAPALGPTLGGFLIQYYSWRTLFFLNVPVGIVAAAASYFFLKDGVKQTNLKFDTLGAVMSVIFFGSLLLALSKGQTEGWTSLYIVTLFFISAVSFALLLWAELTAEAPLLNLKVFKNLRFSASTLTAGLITMAMMGGTFMMPIYLQNVQSMTALDSGILLLPQSVVMALMMPISGKLQEKIGVLPLGVVGLLILGVTTYELGMLTADTSHLWINVILTIRGFGIGLCMMPISTVGMSSVPKELINDASPLSNVTRQVMSSMGIAILTTLMNSRQYLHYYRITENVPSYSDTAASFISALSGVLAQGGVDSATSSSTAIGYLAGIMQKEALVRGIADTFYISAIPAFICIPLVFLLREKKKAKEQSSSEVSEPASASAGADMNTAAPIKA
ncbi:DHA2 family efflux MFS transporter permease subunit [Paenibacillus doosanensis]|uniref:Multidrug export protein EmrB n=1 Tax=Paenibacillus konkukensis TaxID=2020716 RepID=A0ABY4RMR1_9BACL|nr:MULTISPECIES: DHA2 family efflux MFS transporter permease subunit [Paenibacillus]MCS7460054.1 DHA2 family efflux MFS transporter permease subunit [Paenibacillus doosanensis]UQZ82709.1 Multidrug export protein EmrB [Paenibacillus konkukensis]